MYQKSKNKHLISLIILITLMFIFSSLTNQNYLINSNNSISDYKKESDEEDIKSINQYPVISDINYINSKYNISDWWNTTFRYRICIELEEIDSINRYQPLDIFLVFQENEHFVNTSRLVSYNATGLNEWSNPVPIQLWNITYCQNTNYIKTCTITFIANITANSNKLYFFYYNDNNEGIEIPNYKTEFSTILSNGKLNVTVGPQGSKYQALIEEGYGISEFQKDGINYHTKYSLTPEKQLNHQSVELLLHCDEESGSVIYDSSYNELEGDLIGNSEFNIGVLHNGIKFDGIGDYITFDDKLNRPFGSTSKAFTITMWIMPTSLSNSSSNHGVMNCFMAKASKPYSDNFELGIFKENNTHGLLHVYIGTALIHKQSIYGDVMSNPILTNEWNFIAVRYFEGNVDVQINDVIYGKDINNTEPWDGSVYLDQASGSHFTLGGTLDSDIYYNGTLDEIVVYNSSISNVEINNNKLAKKKSSINSIIEIESGIIFSRYKILWNPIFDMNIEDIITFYNDYNLWNIYRSIYFDNPFDPDKASMNALNTYYNLTEIYNQQEGKYFYDSKVKQNIISAGFNVENYSIIHIPKPYNVSFGIFIADYMVSDILYTSVSEFKGKLTYNKNITEFTPGSINDFDNNDGGSNFKLNIDLWEFIDTINQSGSLNDNDLLNYFNNTLVSLRNPIDIKIYHQEALFYTLVIHVEDIDNNPVNQATVSLYNLTNNGNIDQCISKQKTSLGGNTTFKYLKNDTYTVNLTYEKYGQPAFQVIHNPVNITVNETNSDRFGKITYNFYNVSLTSLKMKVQRIDPDTHEIKEPVVNANVSFWINNGSGNKHIGYELTDISGMAIFQWRNFSSANDGNITFAIIWYDNPHNISTEGDLLKENSTHITLYFYRGNIIVVNLTSYKFATALVESIPDGVYIGDEITFQVNYSYTINYTDIKPIENARVYYYIKIDNTNISSKLIEFNETTIKGTYSTKINTSNPEDPNINFLAEISYRMVIHASKAGYIPTTTIILFELLFKSTNLTSDQNYREVVWNENFTLEVYYEDIHNLPYKGIDGASVNYSVIGMPNINGSIFPNGIDGWYQLELNSSIFNITGEYDIKITANKKFYEFKTIFIEIKILARPTLINGKPQLQNKIYNLYFGEMRNFTISYTDEFLNETIIDLDDQSYIWKIYDVDFKLIAQGERNLILNEENLYVLDSKDFRNFLGTITFEIILFKMNYEEKEIKLIYNIVENEFEYELSTGFKEKNIEMEKDISKKLRIKLFTPSLGNVPLTGAKVILNIKDKDYDFIEIEDGLYELDYKQEEVDTTFFKSEYFQGKIDITIYGYEDKNINVNIIIKREEIFPGVPIFYFLLFLGAIFFVLGITIIDKLIKIESFTILIKKLKKNNVMKK